MNPDQYYIKISVVNDDERRGIQMKTFGINSHSMPRHMDFHVPISHQEGDDAGTRAKTAKAAHRAFTDGLRAVLRIMSLLQFTRLLKNFAQGEEMTVKPVGSYARHSGTGQGGICGDCNKPGIQDDDDDLMFTAWFKCNCGNEWTELRQGGQE